MLPATEKAAPCTGFRCRNGFTVQRSQIFLAGANWHPKIQAELNEGIKKYTNGVGQSCQKAIAKWEKESKFTNSVRALNGKTKNLNGATTQL